MTVYGVLYDAEVDSEEERDSIARRIARAPVVDEHGRKLLVKVRRAKPSYSRQQEKYLCVLCETLAKQLVYDTDVGCFCHVSTGLVGARFSKDAFRHFFAANAMKSPIINNPFAGDGHPEQIAMSESTVGMSREEYKLAIDMAITLGDQNEVVWGKSKQQQPKE